MTDAECEPGGYHCEIHDLKFEDRTWCPQCEIESDMRAEDAVAYLTHVADSGPASSVALKPGEALNQCSECGRRVITAADETTPGVCACNHDAGREWNAVCEKSSDPDPMAAAIVDVAERWPIDSDDAREFLMDVGYTPPRGGARE